MTIVTSLSIYIIGIIVCAIGTGIWARLTSHPIDETDICVFCGAIFFWPFGLCLAVVCVAFFFLVKPIGFLMLKSGDCCDGIVKWWKSKKEQSNNKDEVV